MDLNDKVVLVTGGSDGIGRHICLKLASEGCQLAILGRDKDRLSAVEAECAELGAPKVAGFQCDIRDAANLEATAESVLEIFGGLDVLVNNAGIWPKQSTLTEVDADVLVSTVQTNLTAAMQLTRHVLPSLRRRKGIVLNIASKSGVVAQSGQAVYSATKYGVRGFTDVLKEDERETGVRVAAIYQSGTNTQMFAKAGEDVPNRIFTEPGDLADVVVFMLSRPPKIWLHDVRVEI